MIWDMGHGLGIGRGYGLGMGMHACMGKKAWWAAFWFDLWRVFCLVWYIALYGMVVWTTSSEDCRYQ